MHSFLDPWSNLYSKTKLRTPKGYSEAVNLRQRDNIMAKKKRTKKQTLIYKTLHRKLNIDKH
jgi:hypothetical protein